MVMRNCFSAALAAAISLALISPASGADERLTKAKDLYRSAAYDEALALLETVPADASAADAVAAYEYRVFCLVALDRKDDAKRAIATLVAADPSYQMPEAQSPRLRALFTEVRRAVLPSVVHRAYADAKAAFDRKDPVAASQFERVLLLLHDPDLASAPGLADLATVASAFRDLSRALENAQTAPPPVPAPRESAVAPRRANAVYRDGEPNVVPPVAVSQVLPAAQVMQKRVWDGAVEVLIDRTGKVVTARMSESVFPSYDRQLIRAAMNWTYRPALKDGVPTQYVKIIRVHLDTRSECASGTDGQCRQPGAE